MERAGESARLRQAYELGRAFASKTDLDELIPAVVAKSREVLSAEGVAVLLLDAERDELYFPYVSEDDPDVAKRLSGVRFSSRLGIAGSVLHSGRAEKVDDVQRDARFFQGVDLHTRLTTKSMLAAPLTAGETVIGVVEAINHVAGTPFGDEDLAVLACLADSIALAIDNAHRFSRIKSAGEVLRVQVGTLRRDLARRESFNEIVAASLAMSQVFRLMESAAASSIPVLIEGETGTGKELIARALHRSSARAGEPFIAVNCAAFAETLLESELFGHRRGAFTGAIADHPGLFKAASGGVILLDEIGEMPLSMQPKLLRILEHGEVTAVGDTRPQKIDVRVISATNKDLKTAIEAHTFRDDLYYRLAAFPIRVPPLRERRDDIPLLAARFLSEAVKQSNKRIPGIEPATLDSLQRFNWPGNVRQLQNEIERAVALAPDGESICAAHLSSEITNSDRQQAPSSRDSHHHIDSGVSAGARPLREARSDFEARYIAGVLESSDGNVSHAAVALGISRVALQKKMKEYKLR